MHRPYVRCCRIHAADDGARPRGWSKSQRRLPFHLLVVSLDGDERIVVDETPERIPSGGAYLIPAGTRASIGSPSGNRPVFMHFDLVHDEHAAARARWRWFDDPLGAGMPPPQPDPGPVLGADIGLRPPPAIGRLLRTRLPHLVRTWRRGDALSIAEAENGLEAVLLAWARAVAAHPAGESDILERIAHAEATALESLDRAFGVDAFAAAAGLRRSRFHALYRRVRGEAPGDFLRRARLEAASALLAAGTGVAATARAVGFADRAAFSRAFSKAVGTPPARWATVGRYQPGAMPLDNAALTRPVKHPQAANPDVACPRASVPVNAAVRSRDGRRRR